MCFSVFLFKGSIINIVAITYTAMVGKVKIEKSWTIN